MLLDVGLWWLMAVIACGAMGAPTARKHKAFQELNLGPQRSSRTVNPAATLIGALSDSVPEPRCRMTKIVPGENPRLMSTRAVQQNGVRVAVATCWSPRKASNLPGSCWPWRSSDGTTSMTAVPASTWPV